MRANTNSSSYEPEDDDVIVYNINLRGTTRAMKAADREKVVCRSKSTETMFTTKTGYTQKRKENALTS